MDRIANLTLFGSLPAIPARRSAAQPADAYQDGPCALGLRVEYLLATAQNQREKHIARLVTREDPRAREAETLTFTNEDVAETMNE